MVAAGFEAWAHRHGTVATPLAVLAVAMPYAFFAARLWMPLPFLNNNLRLPVPSVIPALCVPAAVGNPRGELHDRRETGRLKHTAKFR